MPFEYGLSDAMIATFLVGQIEFAGCGKALDDRYDFGVVTVVGRRQRPDRSKVIGIWFDDAFGLCRIGRQEIDHVLFGHQLDFEIRAGGITCKYRAHLPVTEQPFGGRGNGIGT